MSEAPNRFVFKFLFLNIYFRIFQSVHNAYQYLAHNDTKKEADITSLKGADNTDREQLEKWTKSLLDEFLNIGNFEEALQEITEKFSNNTISTFLENVFEKVI